TGLAAAAVHVDLASVGILARWTTHSLRLVLGIDGVDASHLHAEAHQLDEVVPDRLPLAAFQQAALHERVDTVAEEHLGPVDVADPGQDRLVHEQRSNGAPGPATP